MTFHPSISAEQRERIIELARAGGARNKIAAEVGVGVGTVSRYAKAAGLSFDRSRTRAATEAARIDNAAKREALAIDVLSEVASTLASMKLSGPPTSTREEDQRARAVASLSRAMGETFRASPIGDTTVDEIRDAFRSFRGALHDSVRLRNIIQAYETKFGELSAEELEAADPSADRYGQVDQE
ncbi:hypothetical protein [Microbacterium sp. LWH3-1.2]|uniref:hypothetical protein n=1 Tax=Microbacterium sp. LWH3-1.2 TaxID=3135256 RepID=UPI0034222A49